MEEWRDIKGYEGLYQVSNYGRVKSLSRVVNRVRNGKLPIKECLLKPHDNGRGYPLFSLVNAQKQKHSQTIHHFVWDAFGDKPRNGHKAQIDHIDDNPYNNHISNLRLVTASENSIKRSSKYKKASRYPNVSSLKNGTWEMGIMRDRVRYRKAGFKTETQAFLARQKLLITLGESIEKH